MSVGTILIVVALIVGYCRYRDWIGKKAQHDRVIASKCSCGDCHDKKMRGKNH